MSADARPGDGRGSGATTVDVVNNQIGALSAATDYVTFTAGGNDVGFVDLILNCGVTPEQLIPDGAPLVQRALGLGDSGVACFSVHATCLGFLVGLDLAASLITSGRYARVLLVTAEIASTPFLDNARGVMLARYVDARSPALDAILEAAGVLRYFADHVDQATAVPDVRERAQPQENRPYAVG